MRKTKQDNRMVSGRLGRSRKLNLEVLEPRLCLSSFATVDLIPLPGHDSSTALGLNDNALAVGRSGLSADSTQRSAVVWQVNVAGSASVSTLPGLDGHNSSSADDVNNQGMIAGESLVTVSGTGRAHAVVWTGSFGSYEPHDLGALGGSFVYSDAVGISQPDDLGNIWVVGNSSTDSNLGPFLRHGVLWQVDVQGNVLSSTDLGPDDSSAFAMDVEAIGQSLFVAGRSDGQAVVWEADLEGNVVGRTDLGTLGGQLSFANAINGNGAVAGEAELADSFVRDAFLHENGVMTDLGSLGNNSSGAVGLNDTNVVVGWYENRKPPNSNILGERYAFVWEDGSMHDLFEQVADKNFWRLFAAFDVNADAAIVGSGSFGTRRDNQPHGFLALPEDPGGPTTTMHVGDLDGMSVPGRRGKWNVTVTITVHSANEGPVDGATVSGSWSAGASGSSSCVTSASGQCDVTKNNINKSSATFTVDTITLSGSTYASDDNHDVDGDSNGTAIIVLTGSSAGASSATIASRNTLSEPDVVLEDLDYLLRNNDDDPLAHSDRVKGNALPTKDLPIRPPADDEHVPLPGLDVVLNEEELEGLISHDEVQLIDEALLQLFAKEL